ncbi:RTA1 like protein-domain-containing protein, partial [Mycena leptocephala]
IPPAVVSLVHYGISALVLWINYFVFPPARPRFMLWLIFGMTAMTVGFGFRVWYIYYPHNIIIFILMDLFIILSPCFFLATDYLIFSRLVASFDAGVTRNCLLIRHSIMVKFFVWSDVTTFNFQSAGGNLTATTNPKLVSIGSKLTMIGLVLQAASFMLFTVVLFVFGWRVAKRFPEVWRHKDLQRRPFNPFSPKPIDDWRILYYVLCATCVGILIRSVFRIAEYAGGYGYLSLHEAYFYIFDALPLWIAMSLYCVVWPVRALVDSEHPGGDHELASVVRSSG